MSTPQILVAIAAVGGLLTVSAAIAKLIRRSDANAERGEAGIPSPENTGAPTGLSDKEIEAIRQLVAAGPRQSQSKPARKRPFASYGARKSSYLRAFPVQKKLQKSQ